MNNEKQILEFWKKNNIFKKVQDKNKGNKRWSFLDGPITANNPMGVHHAWGRTYKDVFQRYKAMRGYDLRYQNGFDCQGLWVEVEVEKELGFKSKKDIEKYGIAQFVEKCKQRVKKYSAVQTEQSKRLGQFMDWDNSYFTMSDENNYAIWHFLKKCHDKKLLYKGRDSVPWCPRCATSISQHEILTEDYKEMKHRSIFFKMPLIDEDSSFLVWTTTPWTLPGNVSLAVHPDFDYVKVKSSDGTYILLKEKKDLVQGEVIEEFKGKELKGVKYKGLFDELEAVDVEHFVVLWDEVTKEEGTGIVHMAPGGGSEDFHLGKELGLGVIDMTDEESKYRRGFGELTGKFVGSEQIRDLIFDNLSKKKRVYKLEDYSHRYPICWRCKSELIFRVVDEWYIAMNPLRKALMKTAKKISWIPSFGLDRELDWLKNMRDWLISKKRYWGLALPIFECSCGKFEVIGSREELEKRAVKGWDEFDGHTPHRPWIDKVKIKCSCGELVSRIPDVGNPWLDAGIVPFSTLKYFSDKKYWKKWFPIEFVCESFPGQFKNWFYSLLVMSQVLENKPPFKTLLGYASVVDEKGQEMHKSKGNAIWFDEAVEKIGADVMRWMYVKQNPVNNLRFGFKTADETRRKLLTLWNSYVFFNTYADEKEESIKPDTLLDKWILSKLNGLINTVTKSLDEFDPCKASKAIEEFFINDLSLWYIRRTRKNMSQGVLYHVLITLNRLIAPMIPFISEEVYQKIRREDMPESIHLNDWPETGSVDKGLEQEMDKVRDIVAQALALRSEKGLKVRQPLAQLKIKDKINEELMDLIKQEVNVKQVVVGDNMELDTNITPELKQEGQVREIIRQIQDLRKKAGLTPKDNIIVYYSMDNDKLILDNKEMIVKQTNSKDLQNTDKRNFKYSKSINIEDKELFLGI